MSDIKTTTTTPNNTNDKDTNVFTKTTNKLLEYSKKTNIEVNTLLLVKSELEKGTCINKISKLCGKSFFITKKIAKEFGYVGNMKSTVHISQVLTKKELHKIDLVILKDLLQIKNSLDISKNTHRHTHYIRNLKLQYGINTPSDGSAAKIAIHLRDNYSIPISPLIREILTGTLLGDGHLKTPYKNQLEFVDIGSYNTARELLLYLRCLSGIDSEREIKKLIPTFNTSIKEILNSATAQLSIHKSAYEHLWLTTVAEVFESEGYPTKGVKVRNGKDKHGKEKATIYFDTQSSIQLFNEYLRWYNIQGIKRKIIPSDIKITPTTLLVWLIDDGSHAKDRIYLCSLSFTYEENIILAKLVQDTVGIAVRTSKQYDSRNNKTYFYLNITHEKNINKFWQYLQGADPRLLKVANELFPYKLSPLLKKDFFASKKKL